MKLPTFVEKVCRTGKHCGDCRDLVNGERFRAGAARSGMEMPPDWPACPKNLPWGYKPAEVPQTRQNASGAPTRPSIDIRGRVLWSEMHRLALTDLEKFAAFLDALPSRLPCGTCRTDWLAYVAANPPDLSSPEAAFKWTWRAHEAVNKRLGKVGMSLTDARARWSS